MTALVHSTVNSLSLDDLLARPEHYLGVSLSVRTEECVFSHMDFLDVADSVLRLAWEDTVRERITIVKVPVEQIQELWTNEVVV